MQASANEYRSRLTDLYSAHNPANVPRVDLLLAKYRGQEEFLYRSACAKWSKGLKEGQQVAAASATARPKAALPRPAAAKGEEAARKQGGKLLYNGMSGLAVLQPDPRFSLLAKIDCVLLGESSGFFEQLPMDASSGSDRSSDSSSESDISGETSSSEAPEAAVPEAPVEEAAPEEPRQEVEEAAEEDSDINDEMIAAALGKLKASEEQPPRPPATCELSPKAQEAPVPISASPKVEPAPRPPAPVRSRREPAVAKAGGTEKAPSNGSAVTTSPGNNATKAKAWGAPPPLRGARGQRTRARELDDDTGARPKAPPMALPEAPALFDQWLSCLKFVTGWNDQRNYTPKEVREALVEHLTGEGIENGRTVEKLCSTMVPLLLDLRRIDAAVVKNLRPEALRGLKIVQVSILRIVTFELCRERDGKAALKKEASANPEQKPEALAAATLTTPYLASDISSLAKVVQHFRFDRTFSEGLHQLILSIRRQKRAARNGRSVARRNGNSEHAEAKKRKAPLEPADGKAEDAAEAAAEPAARKRPRMVS